jgi:hypothetical protein
VRCRYLPRCNAQHLISWSMSCRNTTLLYTCVRVKCLFICDVCYLISRYKSWKNTASYMPVHARMQVLCLYVMHDIRCHDTWHKYSNIQFFVHACTFCALKCTTIWFNLHVWCWALCSPILMNQVKKNWKQEREREEDWLHVKFS